MRTEKDFLGEVSIPEDALYGVHSYRARENFPSQDQFPVEWFRATGTVKLACYRTVRKLLKALQKEHPDVIEQMRIIYERWLKIVIYLIMNLLKEMASIKFHLKHLTSLFKNR